MQKVLDRFVTEAVVTLPANTATGATAGTVHYKTEVLQLDGLNRKERRARMYRRRARELVDHTRAR